MDDFRTRARAGYERGRRRLGLFWSAIVVPFAVLAALVDDPLRAVPLGLSVTVLAGWMAWFGQRPGRALRIGLPAGAIAYIAPLLGRGTDLVTPGCGLTASCFACCAGGGLVAGLVLSVGTDGDLRTLAWSLLLCGALAALTCLPLGGAALGVAVLSTLAVTGTHRAVRALAA